MKSIALLTGFFTETNTYVKAGTMDSFIRTAGQELIDQNRDTNTNYGAYIDYCEKHDIWFAHW
ncbi:MAG: M81 family metallopeptidase [Gammaproteobacteria bacterium]